MKAEILYIKDQSEEYAKIISIKPEGFDWGESEKKDPFGIVLLTISQDKINDIENYNLYCLDDKEDPKKLIDTEEKYQIKKEEIIIKEGEE